MIGARVLKADKLIENLAQVLNSLAGGELPSTFKQPYVQQDISTPKWAEICGTLWGAIDSQ